MRLYTKPGTRQSLPFLTMGLPLVALALLVACLAFPGNLGLFLQKLYLTWSPYHYAAQTFGLSVMYCYRSGCQLGDHDKRLLRWVCLLPFLYSFFCAPRIGLEWIVPAEVLAGIPGMPEARNILRETLFLLSFVAPFGLLVRLRRGGGNMPLIAPLLMIANGIWWFVLIPMQAFVWATVFHGIQYLAITLVFHAREQVAQPGNRHSAAVHALRFYAMSMLLGFCLFCALPQAWLLLGFGMVESLLLVVAAINVHHFVVDAYIWKLGRGESNRQITTS